MRGAVIWAAGAAAWESSALAETYRLVGVVEGKMAHMRARPASRARPVGYIPSDAHGIERVGACSGDWCQVRYQQKTGWVSRDLLEVEKETAQAGQNSQHVSASPVPGEAAKMDAPSDRGGAIPPDALQGDAGPGPAQAPEPGSGPAGPGQAADSEETGQAKAWVIAGVADGALLELREAPSDDASVIGSVPHDASGLEYLGRSVKKWSQVRYQGVSGWILGRHLAEGDGAGPRFRVVGVPLLEAAPVREYPDAEAGVVGTLPSYASGIVAIGASSGEWRHIRYLGMVGWVERRYLEPLTERRS
jgi:SH3-like domain-containing protein